jgi:tetrahydromethanopterin S-methyltransferase subunit F
VAWEKNQREEDVDSARRLWEMIKYKVVLQGRKKTCFAGLALRIVWGVCDLEIQ